MKFILFTFAILFSNSCSHLSNTDQLATKTDIEILKQELKEDIETQISNLSLSKVTSSPNKPKTLNKNKILIGRIEWISIKDPNIRLKARVDTGAKTSSLHAEDIIEKIYNNKKFINFTTIDSTGKKVTIESEVVRSQKVKSSNGIVTTRYVIKLPITLGNRTHIINVNLNDREYLQYNFLIGRNLLMGKYIVDVSESRLLN